MKLFEQYFLGTLSPEDQQELALGRQNPDFENEFQSYQQAFQLIQQHGVLELKQRLQARERALYGSVRRRRIRQALSIAALFLFVCLAVVRWAGPTGSKDYLSDYFSPAMNTLMPSFRGVGEQGVDSPLTAGFQAYDQQAYQAAVTYFARSHADGWQDAIAFYQANALLALDSSGVAIPLLQPLVDQESAYRYQSQWYLALAYLDAGQLVAARDLLVLVREQDGVYQQQAEAILQKLDD